MKDESNIQFYGEILDSPKRPLWLDVGTVFVSAREYHEGHNLNIYIEFIPKGRHCLTKKV